MPPNDKNQVAPSELANTVSVAEAKKLREELEQLRRENAKLAKLAEAQPRKDPAAPLEAEYRGVTRWRSKFQYYSSRESRLYMPGEIITLVDERPGKKGWTRVESKAAMVDVEVEPKGGQRASDAAIS